MTRAERLGLGGATLGHVALIAALSFGLFAAPKPDVPKTQSVDVQLIDEVGPADTAPIVSQAAPAPSVAPELGTPEDTAPQPTPQAPPPLTKASPLPAPNKPAPPRIAAPPAAKPAPPRGGRLGANFLKGITDNSQPGEATAPRATVGPAQVASLASAIARQVQPCADRIVTPGPGAEDIRTKLNLRLNPDGSFAAEPRVIGQTTTDENARYGTRVAELARAAFKQCAPFKLPPDLYDGWKNINLNYRLPA